MVVQVAISRLPAVCIISYEKLRKEEKGRKEEEGMGQRGNAAKPLTPIPTHHPPLSGQWAKARRVDIFLYYCGTGAQANTLMQVVKNAYISPPTTTALIPHHCAPNTHFSVPVSPLLNVRGHFLPGPSDGTQRPPTLNNNTLQSLPSCPP